MICKVFGRKISDVIIIIIIIIIISTNFQVVPGENY